MISFFKGKGNCAHGKYVISNRGIAFSSRNQLHKYFLIFLYLNCLKKEGNWGSNHTCASIGQLEVSLITFFRQEMEVGKVAGKNSLPSVVLNKKHGVCINPNSS